MFCSHAKNYCRQARTLELSQWTAIHYVRFMPLLHHRHDSCVHNPSECERIDGTLSVLFEAMDFKQRAVGINEQTLRHEIKSSPRQSSLSPPDAIKPLYPSAGNSTLMQKSAPFNDSSCGRRDVALHRRQPSQSFPPPFQSSLRPSA